MTPSPVAFMQSLIDPETGEHFVLNEAEREFLCHAFELKTDGTLRYPEQAFGAIKKSGKTAFAALMMLYVVRVLGRRLAEGYCCANDAEQSQGRVFQAIRRIVEATAWLKEDARVTDSKITFKSTGATITALANDYAGAAGANPTITVFDELWGYTSERAHRLWDEMVPPPTRKIALRLTVSYAGFEGESAVFEGLYKRGKAGQLVGDELWATEDGLLMAWHTKPIAPWQTAAWLDQMRSTLRPPAYLRQCENVWVSTESSFVDMADWDACVDEDARPVIEDRRLPVWLGIDASTKHDSTAIVACAYDRDAKKVRLVAHRVFTPSRYEPIDFLTIETAILDLDRRFHIVEARFDPYQLVAVAQRLRGLKIPVVEFSQTVGNLTEASQNLYDLITGHNLVAYPDDAIRLAVQRCVALETTRGWRIAKEKSSHKIDSVIALAQAALGAVESAATKRGFASWTRERWDRELAAARQPMGIRHAAQVAAGIRPGHQLLGDPGFRYRPWG
jgi:phage terminase large subunit-like protein